MARPRIPIGQHGQINLRKTATGWRADTRIRKDDGKLHRIEANRPSREGARIALEEACKQAQHEATGSITATSTVEQLSLAWLDAHKKDIRPQTYVRYAANVHNHVIPDIGANEIAAVTPLLIKNYVLKIRDSIGGGVAQTVRTVINQIFDLAVMEHAITVNPARQIGRVRLAVHKPGSDAIPPERIPEFVHNVERSRLHTITKRLVLFMLYTGLRPGEALALTWDKIDFDEQTMTIDATSVHFPQHTYVQNDTKTSAGIRAIRVSDKALNILKKEYELFGQDVPYVFPTARGGVKTTTAFDVAFKTARPDLGFPELRLTPHSLRKTCVTWLHYKGIGSKDITDYVGHADRKVTEKIYMKKNVHSDIAAKAIDSM